MTSNQQRIFETVAVTMLVIVNRIAGMSVMEAIVGGIFMFTALIFLHWDGGTS